MEIEGFPDYLIYDDGRVYSKKRNIFLKEQKTKLNYRFVWLNGKIKTIHRLVAEHYIPNPENKKEVDHKNRDRSDNRLENLRWATRIENSENTGKRYNNTSGHKNIGWVKERKKWKFHRKGRFNKIKYFDNKIDAICFKFIYNLKIKSLLN
jgi:hypothetical protein